MMNKESWKYKLPWIPLFFLLLFLMQMKRFFLFVGMESSLKGYVLG